MKSRLVKATIATALGLSLMSAAAGASGAVGGRVQAPRATTHQWGIDVWIGFNCEPTVAWENWGKAIFGEIKALHANSVAFTFPFYTDGHTANTYFAKEQCNTEYATPTPTQVGQLVDLAHKAGLSVFLRPYLSATDMQKVNPTYWSGNIAPTNPQTWFTNYLNTLKPYLQMAQTDKVERFAISTELSSMTGYSYWGFAISAARALYKGNLVFTATWQNSPNKKVWSGSTAGIDTYPYLRQLKPTATVPQIIAAWNGELKRYPIPGKLSSWTDDETGIPAQVGAYASPNLTNLPLSRYPFNQSIQVNWFKAACSFAKGHKLGGIYFSTVLIYSGNLLKKPDPSAPFELQPAAIAEIKTCFA